MKWLERFLALCISLSFSPCTWAHTFYQIDFEAPGHVANGPLTTGNSVRMPTSVISGNPTIAASGSAFDSQSLKLTGNASQIGLGLGHASAGYLVPGYSISFDVLSVGLGESDFNFGVVLDTPLVRNVQMSSWQNTVSVYPGTPLSSVNVGNYADGVVQHFVLNVDFQSDWWTVAMNNTTVYSSAFGADDIQSIRFGLGTVFPNPRNSNAVIYLDNILVTTIPEPTASALFWCGSVFVFGFSRFRRFFRLSP